MARRSYQSLVTRLVTVFCAITVFFGLVAAPSLARGIFGDEPADSPISSIMKDAQEFTGPDKQPMSLEEIQARSKGGLNEIQGTDDADKMINTSQVGKPDNIIARKIDKGIKKNSD